MDIVWIYKLGKNRTQSFANTLCLFANDNAFNKSDQTDVVIFFIRIMCYTEW